MFLSVFICHIWYHIKVFGEQLSQFTGAVLICLTASIILQYVDRDTWLFQLVDGVRGGGKGSINVMEAIWQEIWWACLTSVMKSSLKVSDLGIVSLCVSNVTSNKLFIILYIFGFMQEEAHPDSWITNLWRWSSWPRTWRVCHVHQWMSWKEKIGGGRRGAGGGREEGCMRRNRGEGQGGGWGMRRG